MRFQPRVNSGSWPGIRFGPRPVTALILSLLSYASYFKGDINIISLKGLIKAIFLFKGVKRRIFGCKLYKRRFTAFGY